MREITTTLTLPVDGASRTFRFTKLDAFSGASLLRTVLRVLPSGTPEEPADGDLFTLLFSGLSEAELRSLMTACLQHTEVLLEAGWQPVMQQGEWSWDDLAHDAPVCLKLTWESLLWTLRDFFAESGPASRSAPEPSSP